MPDWVRPDDIHFDHAAAHGALEALAAMRATLEWSWALEDRSASAAMVPWSGLAADAFRSSHAARRAVTEELAGRLGLLAAAIDGAIEDAVSAQARIDTAQAEWDAQLRVERRIAAETAVGEAPGGAPPADPIAVVSRGLR